MHTLCALVTEAMRWVGRLRWVGMRCSEHAVSGNIGVTFVISLRAHTDGDDSSEVHSRRGRGLGLGGDGYRCPAMSQ